MKAPVAAEQLWTWSNQQKLHDLMELHYVGGL